MESRVKCDKYTKGRNYTVKKIHIVKFCQIVELYKNFEKYLLKRVLSIRLLAKLI